MVKTFSKQSPKTIFRTSTISLCLSTLTALSIHFSATNIPTPSICCSWVKWQKFYCELYVRWRIGFIDVTSCLIGELAQCFLCRFVKLMRTIHIERKLFSCWMILKFLASMAHVSLLVLHVMSTDDLKWLTYRYIGSLYLLLRPRSLALVWDQKFGLRPN